MSLNITSWTHCRTRLSLIDIEFGLEASKRLSEFDII